MVHYDAVLCVRSPEVIHEMKVFSSLDRLEAERFIETADSQPSAVAAHASLRSLHGPDCIISAEMRIVK